MRYRAIMISASLLALLCRPGACQWNVQQNSWERPDSHTQLFMDDTIVPVGKGAVFCPSMTDPENEPIYGVLSGDQVLREATMGRRIVLNPGEYTLVYGSGTLDQMMRRTVTVEEGATTLIKPDWSGLVIDVIDETRTRIREYYEIINIETLVSYGIGQGAVQRLGENLRTWILPPGRYKIVKPGGTINDIRNFGTIRIVAGEQAQTILVIDSKTLDFRGFGYRPDIRQVPRRDRHWKSRSELAGNMLLTYTSSDESGSESRTNLTATVQWLVDAVYEINRHNVLIWSNLEEGLSVEGGGALTKYRDKAEIRPTYIYRLGRLASPYIRATAESQLFITRLHFDEPTDYTEFNENGDTLRTVNSANEVVLGKAFSPLVFKQGIGVNSILVKSFSFNLNSRIGYGTRQTHPRGARLYDSGTQTISPVVQTDVRGTELILFGDMRLGRYILFDADFDMLMPQLSSDRWVFDGENRLRITLTNYISLLMTMEYWKNENVEETQARYQALLRFSKFF